MLLSELQKQKKTKNIKCRIKKKKKKARKVFYKFMIQYIKNEYGDCPIFKCYHGNNVSWCEFIIFDMAYELSIFESCQMNINTKVLDRLTLMSDDEAKAFMKFVNRVYKLYTRTDYLDLKRRAITFMLCNSQNHLYPKGVDKIIAKKILFFTLKRKKIMIWLSSLVREDGCGLGELDKST